MQRIQKAFEKSISVVFATDNNFVPYLYVAIQSLVDNSSESNNYDIVILCTDVEEYKQNQFKQLEKDNVSIRFFDMAELMAEYQEVWYTHWNYTEATYYRFFIPQLFADYKKVVYLDCDIIVNCDIAELYNTDMEGKGIAASIGLARQHDDDKYRDYIENILGIKKENYFNAGILVFDINKMKTMSFFKLCIDTLNSLDKPLFLDQDVLNIIFFNDTKYLNCKYNFTWNVLHHYKDSEEKLSENVREDFLKASKNPKIIHYAGKYKPWKSPELSYADYFWKYARKTPFYEELIYRHSPSGLGRNAIYNAVYRRRIYFQYLRCKILKHITFGKTREHYISKETFLKRMVKDYRRTLKK